MFVSLRRCLFLLLLAVPATGPLVQVAQARCRRDCCCRDCCCQVCQHPRNRCCCAAGPTLVPQAAQQPVLQQRDVPVTEYRTEPVTETVPSTIYENVMVDEGSYQSVWIPKLTTRSVARTVYQTRTAYRTVPYQTTRRISEYGLQTVPSTSLRYAPAAGALAYTPGYLTPGVAYSYPLPGTTAVAPLAAATPLAASTAAPVPDPRFLTASPTPVAPRSALTYDDQSVPVDTRSADRGPSLFTPAPSAAQVWRTPRGSLTR